MPRKRCACRSPCYTPKPEAENNPSRAGHARCVSRPPARFYCQAADSVGPQTANTAKRCCALGNGFRTTLDPVLRMPAWSPTMNPSLFSHCSGPLLALASAALFGASTPVAKLLLGLTDPLL